jgi:purine-binding chemotaxis protein CheW
MRTLAVPETKPAPRTPDATDKYLAFYLGNEDFGIDVGHVREIIGIQDITAVPHTATYVKGVINLRGKVVPVLDLRLRLGLAEAAHTPSSCIVVVEAKRAAGPSLTGVIVDGVSEVITAISAEIEPPPDFGRGGAVRHIRGLAKLKGRVKILLDIERILAPSEELAVEGTAENKGVRP